MKQFALYIIAAWLTLTVSSAQTLDTGALLKGGAAAELLDKKCIRTDIAGIIPSPFRAVSLYLDQPRLLNRLQETYSGPTRSGPSITERSPGSYYYTYGNESRIEIDELFCEATSEDTFELILLASGKKFFGRYDVIIHLQFIDTQIKSTAYTAEIYAYPRNMALRFLARRLGTIEKYFERNTLFISRIAQQVGKKINTTSDLPLDWGLPTEHRNKCTAANSILKR